MKIYLKDKKIDIEKAFSDKSYGELGYSKLLKTEKLTEDMIHNVLNIRGITYIWCGYLPNRDELLVREITLTVEKDVKDELESNLKCPYCGYEDSDSWELEEEDSEYECLQCGGIISYERIVTVDYSSEAVRPPKVTHLD